EATSLLVNMLTKHQGKTLVMTGAGISTDSGIPDYRGDEGTYVRNPKHRPILFHELLSSELFRRRYWARAFMGWPKMKQAKPNTSHHVMAWLLEQHYIDHLITQNVDHLHRAAATNTATNSNIIELHGTLYEVECLDCQTIVPREIYQHRLYARNPAFVTHLESQTALKINPDGDVELPDQMSYADFDIPPCRACSSRRMKPKVVFFGENIRKEVTGTAENMVRASTAMLVVGSSLATYSAYRLVRLAKEMGMPIGILCKGPTRADDLASWKIQMACTPVLQQV
ncbi:Sir2 family, partial [Dichotomocladium elegans]